MDTKYSKNSSSHNCSQNNNNNNNNNNDVASNNNIQVNSAKNQIPIPKRTFRKIQIDTAQMNQPIQKRDNTNSIIHSSPSTTTPNNNNNISTTKTNIAISTSKFNREKEKQEIAKLIASTNSINNPKLKHPILYEGSIESPSTSAFTFDTTKKNNTEENIQKGRTNVLSARNSNNNACSVLNTNAVYPLMIKRPMSNLNIGNSTLWKKIDQYKEDPEISQKLNDIMFNIKDVQKAISEKMKERSKLGSAPMLGDNNTLTLDKDLKRFRNFERTNNSRMIIEHSANGFQKRNESNMNLNNNNQLYGVVGGRGSYGKNSYNVNNCQSVLGKGSNSKGKKGPVKIIKK